MTPNVVAFFLFTADSKMFRFLTNVIDVIR